MINHKLMTLLFKNLVFTIIRDPESQGLLMGLSDGGST